MNNFKYLKPFFFFMPDNLDFKYPSRPAWDRGQHKVWDQFKVSDAEDCVIFINVRRAMNNSYIYRTRANFDFHENQLKDAMSKVKFWNDGDIPVGPYTVPVSIAHHMGSLRMYGRTTKPDMRMSKQQCELLLRMFDDARTQLEQWDAYMSAEYEDYVAMP